MLPNSNSNSKMFYLYQSFKCTQRIACQVNHSVYMYDGFVSIRLIESKGVG